MKPWQITLLVLAVALPVGAVFVAQPLLAHSGAFGRGGFGPHGAFGHHGPIMGHIGGRMLDHFGDELDLSDQQRTEIETIIEGAHEQLHARRDEFHAAKQEMHELLAAETYDPAAVQAFADRQGALASELIVLAAQTLHEAKAVLTPEQQVRLQELHDERHQFHEEQRRFLDDWRDRHPANS